MNMIEVILLVLKASIMFAVFAIGLKATFADATFLFRRPGQLPNWRFRPQQKATSLLKVATWADGVSTCMREN